MTIDDARCIASKREGMTGERWCVVANVEGDTVFRDGAKLSFCYPVHGACERYRFNGLSKGGRRVVKWVRIDRLRNVRTGFLAPEVFKAWPEIVSFDDKERAERRAEGLALEAKGGCR